MILGFQTFSVDVLAMTPAQLGLMFTGIGLVSMIMQGFGVHYLLKKGLPERLFLKISLVLVTLNLAVLTVLTSLTGFVIASITYPMFFAPQLIIITKILSERTKAEDQGGMLGVNQSYASIGQMIGPGIAGLLASRWNAQVVFVAAAGLFTLSFMIELFSKKRSRTVIDI